MNNCIYETKNMRLLEVKNRSFKLELDQDLTKRHLQALGLKKQIAKCALIEGEFSIEWDDDIPNVVLESLYLINPFNTKKSIELDLKACYNEELLLLDAYKLEELIAEKDSGDWYSDRIASMAEDAYDRYKDSFCD